MLVFPAKRQRRALDEPNELVRRNVALLAQPALQRRAKRVRKERCVKIVIRSLAKGCLQPRAGERMDDFAKVVRKRILPLNRKCVEVERAVLAEIRADVLVKRPDVLLRPFIEPNDELRIEDPVTRSYLSRKW